MTSLLDRVLGNTTEKSLPETRRPAEKSVREDVPVPCALPRTTFRDRLRQSRQKKEDSSHLRRALGENADPKASLIPSDAEGVNSVGEPFERKLKPVKNVVLEPRDPYAEKEKLMTPAAALVAPDVTPEATTPLEPLPTAGSRSFRTSDAEHEEPALANPPVNKSALGALLGRPSPSQQLEPDAVMSEDRAYALLGVPSPQQMALQEQVQAGAGVPADPLQQGQPMPEHRASDGRAVYDTFRRLMG